MEANQYINLLKQAVLQRFGRQIEDKALSEQLSIDIFLSTDHYISKETIMYLYGIRAEGGAINPKILSFLAKYAAVNHEQI
jgi:hypothetical protein